MKSSENSCSSPNAPGGILLVDKPKAKSSFYLISMLRKISGISKIGHAGTLDPFATGVMILLIGRTYTRLSEHFIQKDKEYLAKIRLGISTDSFDCDGNILSTSDKIPSPQEIEQALLQFQGTIWQIPPMFSAKKIQGKKLYELARKGVEVPRNPVQVTIDCQMTLYEYPYLWLKISCSKGTYIRSIAQDLGSLLGCGAHVEELTRTRCGPFHLKECIGIVALSQHDFCLSKHLRTDEHLSLSF